MGRGVFREVSNDFRELFIRTKLVNNSQIPDEESFDRFENEKKFRAYRMIFVHCLRVFGYTHNYFGTRSRNLSSISAHVARVTDAQAQLAGNVIIPQTR